MLHSSSEILSLNSKLYCYIIRQKKNATMQPHSKEECKPCILPQGQAAMLHSSFGYCPPPNFIYLPRDQFRNVFLRLIHGASGDVLALSHAENVLRRHRIAVGQHAANEIFGCCRLCFGADATEQFLRSYLVIPLQPAESVAVTERERQRFTFLSEG